ncbi:MAG TPA: hypothetical protein VFS09_00470 [Candidatus Eisenbacteria bacterium]|nr:hypothetical protein [Candidatus Eisenbacteria bacterium]
MRALLHAPRFAIAALLSALFVFATPSFASEEAAPPRGDRFVLDASSLDDSLLAGALDERVSAARARLWSRAEAEAMAARLRDRLAVRGDLEASVRLVLLPGPGSTPGIARLGVARPPRGGAGTAARAWVASVRVDGDPAAEARYREAFTRAASERAAAERGRSPLEAIASGVSAVRGRLLQEGRYAGDVAVDSVAADGASTRVYLAVRPGATVTLERLELEGSKSTRPGAAAAIAGLRSGEVLRPGRIEAARDRLEASGLFAVVGEPRVLPGTTPDQARLVLPVEEARASRFDGVLGAAQGGGVTGAIDLALENIAGTGRAAGLRWTGVGPSGTEYAAHYREPALFGRPLDASAALEAHVVDSLFTQTRWALGLGARAASRGRVSLAFARTSTTYSGAARGTNSAWTGSAGLSWRALSPAENPRSGFGLALTGEGGRREENIPGFPVENRRVARGSLLLEGAAPRGRSGVLYASARGEGTSLGGETFPAEELHYVGGNEGLRGHKERAFAGSHVAAFTLEHRWITGPGGGRAFLFADAAWHELDRPLAAGSSAPGSASAALARTELSSGWDFGYGAGLRARAVSGIVGVEIGLRPGASLGAATLHLRYGSRW